MRIGLATVASLLAVASPALGSSGLVYEDGPARSGIASVEVSNGRDVAVTDAQGRYTLPDLPGSRVFVIKPRNWTSPVAADGQLAFYSAPGATTADFALRRSPESDTLVALVTTDPQPVSPKEVSYLENGLVKRLGRRPDLAFGVTLGDVVYDHPDLFGPVSAAFGRIGIPWHYLPGNHDLELGAVGEQAVHAFESAFGPSTYAFHAGPALFIALDDVRPLGGPRYIGGLTPDQLSFVASVLRDSQPSEWVVVMVHIPFFAPYPLGPETFRAADRQALFDLLSSRPNVMVLSGHTHYQRHVMYTAADGWKGAKPLHEANVAAACGGYWSGPVGPDGVPPSTMWDGTPPGYALLSFGADGPRVDYFPSLLPASHQMQLHVPKALPPRQGYVPFYANVFNAHDGWKIEGRVDDRGWMPMTRTLSWDPSYAEAYLAQDTGTQQQSGIRIPEPVVCYHLWRGILPADLSMGTHRIEVRATSPEGTVYTDAAETKIVAP
jgi:C terminal of Calcineurin-like phosphoesterase/Calcineurin-like phosphoesterase